MCLFVCVCAGSCVCVVIARTLKLKTQVNCLKETRAKHINGLSLMNFVSSSGFKR